MTRIAAVIGATGYVGAAVVKSLASAGFAVRCSTRDSANAAWLTKLGDDISVHTLNLGANISDATIEEMSTIFADVDSVFFCAGFEVSKELRN